MKSLTTIRALGDNFIYLLQYQPDHALVVDPGQSGSVLRELKNKNLQLTTILITHNHYDHTAGISDLKKQTRCRIIAPEKIKGCDQVVRDKESINIGKLTINVIATPGHTKTSVCYLIQPSENIPQPIIFTGDTLFTGGCGRVFETDMATMYNSLIKLTTLPDNTIVYPGHDYTEENYRFAMKTKPDKEIQARMEDFKKDQAPTTIAQEKNTNIFLKAKTPEEFATLRQKKDVF